jgi:hypothetical protein
MFFINPIAAGKMGTSIVLFINNFRKLKEKINKKLEKL